MTLFWHAFIVTQALSTVILLSTPGRGSRRIITLPLVALSTFGIAAFAVYVPDSDDHILLWPCLFLPGLLALVLRRVSWAKFMSSSASLFGKLHFVAVVTYVSLLALYVGLAIRHSIWLQHHANLTSFPWQSAWLFAFMPVLSFAPYVLALSIAFVAGREFLMQRRRRAA